MIKTNSSVQIQKLKIPLQQMSPFNGQIRYSNQYSDTPSTLKNQQFVNKLEDHPHSHLTKLNKHFILKRTLTQQRNYYLNQELEKARNEIQNNTQSYEQLHIIKEKVIKLEELIDTQQKEIETWKLKYQKATSGDSKLEIQQMQQQILNVIEENERLNKIISNFQQLQQEKNEEIKRLQMTIQKQKEKLIIFEKSNRPAVLCNAFAIENKKPSKFSINDIRQSKCKINDQDQIANQNNNDHIFRQVQSKSQSDNSDLQNQIKQLQLINKELQDKLQNNNLQTIKDYQKDSNSDQNISILKQEVSNQQILILDEFKKYKQCYCCKKSIDLQSQNLMIKEQLLQWEENLKSLNDQITASNEEEDGIDAVIEEFQSSSANCLKLIDQFQK